MKTVLHTRPKYLKLAVIQIIPMDGKENCVIKVANSKT